MTNHLEQIVKQENRTEQEQTINSFYNSVFWKFYFRQIHKINFENLNAKEIINSKFIFENLYIPCNILEAEKKNVDYNCNRVAAWVGIKYKYNVTHLLQYFFIRFLSIRIKTCKKCPVNGSSQSPWEPFIVSCNFSKETCYQQKYCIISPKKKRVLYS